MNYERDQETDDFQLYENADLFIDDFFQSLKGATDVSPSAYFELFAEPPDFLPILNSFRQTSPPQVLVFDGQSRTGKTWTALGLIKRLLKEKIVDVVWSSAEDSCLIYTQGRTTVEEGIRCVIESLTSLLRERPRHSPQRLIVFLDDFFGSARLRPLAASERGLEFVRDFLTTGDHRNPLLQALLSIENTYPYIILTGRSSIFSLAEARLGVALGDRFARNERAIFQHVNGNFIGEKTNEWLDQCSRVHTAFSTEHSEFELPPLTAFSSDFPVAEEKELIIADVLFGGDVRAIIAELTHAQDSPRSFHGFPIAESTDRIRRLLLTYMAPALVLPLPSIDACIADDMSRSRMRTVLSLEPEAHGDFALRVPNRYYLRAIQDELLDPDSLELLAASLIAHANSGLSSDCDSHLRILSRGVIERGLESVVQILSHDERAAVELRRRLAKSVAGLPGAQEESLLKWETALLQGSLESNDITDVIEKIPLRRGLASAIGWGLYQFKKAIPAANNTESAAFTRICAAFKRRAKDVSNNERDALIVSYSNFIRWAAQMESAPAKGSPLDNLARIVESIDSDPVTKDQMQMVLEDALIWADSYQVQKDVPVVSVDHVPAAQQLWRALESDTVNQERAELNDSCVVNRLFTLEWHNEWKERTSGYKRELLNQWLQKNSQRGLSLIGSNPRLLDDNLNYHWSHMITQWAVWAREWCFAKDPNKHEYQKELIGCVDQKNNHGIHLILKAAIDSALKNNQKNRFRNAFFLLAIRLTGSPDDLEEMHAYLSEKITKASQASEEIRSDLAHAIYELIRQGYIDRTTFPIPPEPLDKSKHQLPRELCAQCLEFVYHPEDQESLDWSTYLEELKTITCLDALPQKPGDLIPYLTS